MFFWLNLKKYHENAKLEHDKKTILCDFKREVFIFKIASFFFHFISSIKKLQAKKNEKKYLYLSFYYKLDFKQVTYELKLNFLFDLLIRLHFQSLLLSYPKKIARMLLVDLI